MNETLMILGFRRAERCPGTPGEAGTGSGGAVNRPEAADSRREESPAGTARPRTEEEHGQDGAGH